MLSECLTTSSGQLSSDFYLIQSSASNPIKLNLVDKGTVYSSGFSLLVRSAEQHAQHEILKS